jgi:hypothetical protein
MTAIEKLEVLSRLVRQGKTDPLIDRTLDKLLAHKRAEARSQYQRIRTDVEAFEKQYDMDSPTFVERYRGGALGDNADFIEWHALWNMLQELEEQLNDLRGV